MISFVKMGFAPAVSACSATPNADGYHGELFGLPFHIHPEETPEAWRALKRAIAGRRVTVSKWTAPVITPEQRQAPRRAARDRLLAASDWTQLPDALAADPALKVAWARYRQELRDLAMDGEDWPSRPAD